MSCRDVRDLVPDHVTERLPADDAGLVEQHLRLCDACRRFADDVRALYALDTSALETVPAPTPRETGAHVWLTERASPAAATRTGLRWAAALLAVALGTWTWLATTGGDDGDGHVDLADALPTIRLDAPDLPAAAPGPGWITSREEAERLVAYTGRPLLEQVVFSLCPRCISVNTLLADRALERRLDGFVRFRRAADDGIPDLLDGRPEAFRYPFVFPAMWVEDGSCRTEPVFEIAGWSGVESVLRSWEDACPADGPPPLDDATFESALADLRAVPDRVAEARYADALDRLDRVESLGERHGSRLADDARTLRHALLVALDDRVTRLETLAADAPEHATAIARPLLAQLAGTDLARRVRALLP